MINVFLHAIHIGLLCNELVEKFHALTNKELPYLSIVQLITTMTTQPLTYLAKDFFAQ